MSSQHYLRRLTPKDPHRTGLGKLIQIKNGSANVLEVIIGHVLEIIIIDAQEALRPCAPGVQEIYIAAVVHCISVEPNASLVLCRDTFLNQMDESSIVKPIHKVAFCPLSEQKPPNPALADHPIDDPMQ